MDDAQTYVRALIAFLFIIGLLLVFAVGARLWGRKLGLIPAVIGGEGKKIQLMETAMVDTRHRLLRVRVDGREHLILVGGATPVVVESRDVQGQG